jgi:hypothetical protein
MRTTTSARGLKMFLKHCVGYWRMLEGKVDLYQSDPIMKKIRAELDRPEGRQLAAVMEALRAGQGLVGAVQGLTRSFRSFEETSRVDTDVIEAHVYRLLQIVSGTHQQGAGLFAGTPWSA